MLVHNEASAQLNAIVSAGHSVSTAEKALDIAREAMGMAVEQLSVIPSKELAEVAELANSVRNLAAMAGAWLEESQATLRAELPKVAATCEADGGPDEIAAIVRQLEACDEVETKRREAINAVEEKACDDGDAIREAPRQPAAV